MLQKLLFSLQYDKEQAIEKAIEADAIFKTPTPVPGADATWMQAKELEAHEKENMQYSDVKRDLREKIRDMRRQVGSHVIWWRDAFFLNRAQTIFIFAWIFFSASFSCKIGKKI